MLQSGRVHEFFTVFRNTLIRLFHTRRLIVAGISEWPRRVRELRVEHGWAIISGVTAKELLEQNDFPFDSDAVRSMRTKDYMLISLDQDREAAHRWHVAKDIRNIDESVQQKILTYLQEFCIGQQDGEIEETQDFASTLIHLTHSFVPACR